MYPSWPAADRKSFGSAERRPPRVSSIPTTSSAQSGTGQEAVPQPALDVERHQDVGPDAEELGDVAIAEGRVERVRRDRSDER